MSGLALNCHGLRFGRQSGHDWGGSGRRDSNAAPQLVQVNVRGCRGMSLPLLGRPGARWRVVECLPDQIHG